MEIALAHKKTDLALQVIDAVEHSPDEPLVKTN